MLPEEGTILVKTATTYAKDLFERVLWTFAAAAGGVAVAAGPANWLDVSVWQGAATAGIIAVGTLLKGLAARCIGDRNSASTARGV